MFANDVTVDRLISLIDAYADVEVSVFGDLILDEYIWGGVERVSPEAPIVVVDVKEESYRLGGAANVAHNLATLGARPSLIGMIGDDEGGSLMSKLLEDVGVNASGLVVDHSRPTTRKSRVISNSQQIVRIDRELRGEVTNEVFQALSSSLIDTMSSSRGVVISDYGKGVVDGDMNHLFGLVHERSSSLPFQYPIVVDPKRIDLTHYKGATCIKPNKKEAQQLVNRELRTREDAIAAALEIQNLGGFDEVMITLGAQGIVLVYGSGNVFELDTIAQEVFDVSGAGDTVSAVYTLSLLVGASPVEATILANCAAARVIREVGTATLDSDDLKALVSFWEEVS